MVSKLRIIWKQTVARSSESLSLTQSTQSWYTADVRVRFQIIGNARKENAGKYQSCMVSKLPIIWKQTALRNIFNASLLMSH